MDAFRILRLRVPLPCVLVMAPTAPPPTDGPGPSSLLLPVGRRRPPWAPRGVVGEDDWLHSPFRMMTVVVSVVSVREMVVMMPVGLDVVVPSLALAGGCPEIGTGVEYP